MNIKELTFKDIAKYGLMAILILAFFSLFKGAINKVLETIGVKQSDADKTLTNIKDVGDKISQNTNYDGSKIASDAETIRYQLGVPSAWWNFSTWTENEGAIYDILKTYDPVSYKLLAIAYAQIVSRDLTSDLKKYMDSYVPQIEHLWN